MLDRTKLPRSFSIPYQQVDFDFVATNASDEASLVLNVGRNRNGTRQHYANGLTIDRHAGQFHFSDEMDADLHALRPLAMKLNAIPAMLLGFAWRFVWRLVGGARGPIAIGGGDAGLAWNLGILVGVVFILAIAGTIGLYVVLPLLALAAISFVLDLAYFTPAHTQGVKSFMEAIADQVRDLVEETVSY